MAILHLAFEGFEMFSFPIRNEQFAHHFDAFSAVSKAPEACELAFCAEFNAASLAVHSKSF